MPRAAFFLLFAAALQAESPRATPVFTYKVVRVHPHDPRAFTQGLVFHNGYLYEGTGQYGQSTLRKVDIPTGKVLQSQSLDPRYFGEGVTIWKDRLVQLTWQTKLGFVYDLATFKPLTTFTYPHEGWGLTHDGKRLIASDGSSTIYFRDPVTFKETGRVTVRDHGRPIEQLNELEFIRGEIWANVWQSDRIVRINPATGAVTGWIDLTGLLPAAQRHGEEDVLNGIAYDPATGRTFVTGKWWSKLYEIRVVPK